MIPLSFKEIARAVGSASALEGKFSSICTDTRKITPGCLFFALKGDNFDGNNFASQAVKEGALCAVVDRDCGLGDRQITVDDTRRALLSAAGYYKSLFDIKTVGVTGSVGKTSTKEMIYTVLSSEYDTLKNEGNLNNEIGVPLTLFNLEKSHRAAVIEMGMNHFGEISRITQAVKPDLAVISNIGVSHIENLGSREGILKAKLEILEGMKSEAPVILNGDDDMLVTADAGSHPVILYGIENSACAFKAQEITSTDVETAFTCCFKGGAVKACLPFTGRHNIYNALAAAAAGAQFGISPEKSLEALKSYKTTGMRQRIVKKFGMTFIEDCYNASPDSQAAAMSVLGSMNCGRKIAVTGDMLELGSYSETAHKAVGEYAALNKTDILFTLGKNSVYTAEKAKELGVSVVKHFDDKEELTASLAETVRQNDAILFKASRGMKLEDVINGLYEILEKRR